MNHRKSIITALGAMALSEVNAIQTMSGAHIKIERDGKPAPKFSEETLSELEQLRLTDKKAYKRKVKELKNTYYQEKE